ncbi:MAG: kynureninase [Bacteroidetes bacterium]|nr:MAG: kynureninase [Bacteroidota bacterium]
MERTRIAYQASLEFARQMDRQDPLKQFRSHFHLPQQPNGQPCLYFCGNSLGLQPRGVRAAVEEVLHDWERMGVEGHFHARHPWMPYHEFLTRAMAGVVGARPQEVVVMNTLTVNLHLMMVSFYRPSPQRHKILIEYDAFPSDKYAVESQIRFHGYDPAEALIELRPRPGEACLRMEDIAEVIESQGNEIALILFGVTNYYTGQLLDMQAITRLGHAQGCVVGFDCAHGAGNVPLQLHQSGADFAVWCSYKYLNSGPGSLAGCFVHERHAHQPDLPRFAGWWGHNKQTRFQMRHAFDPIPGAEGWQLSNPPILSMAAIRASLELFEQAGMDQLRQKALLLTGYLEYLIDELKDERIHLITPRDPQARGCQLSVQVRNAGKQLFERLTAQGVVADWREPDVIRLAPVPLYNSFEDVYTFSTIFNNVLQA